MKRKFLQREQIPTVQFLMNSKILKASLSHVHREIELRRNSIVLPFTEYASTYVCMSFCY